MSKVEEMELLEIMSWCDAILVFCDDGITLIS